MEGPGVAGALALGVVAVGVDVGGGKGAYSGEALTWDRDDGEVAGTDGDAT